jgi:parallel beta-helix repeat protein
VNLDEGGDSAVRGLTLSRHDLGVRVYETSGVRVERNRIPSLFGVGLTAAVGTRVDRNVVESPGIGVGIYVYPGSDDSVISRNVVRQSSFGLLIQISTNTTATRNAFELNTVDGVNIFNSSATLTENTAYGNGDDGIDVDSGTVSLVRNTATSNRDLGIEAAGAGVSGSGNRASGNGNPAQCTGVPCK